ncbi:hypothetical protein JCM10207_006387 [Rhodosporidiobolus poonsookiae]
MASTLSLRQLSHAVYYAEPAAAAATSAAGAASSAAPELILVASWMGAQIRHVEKYLQSYSSMYPSASILLVRSMESDFYSLRDRLTPALFPAVELLQAHAARAGPPTDAVGPKSTVLVHAFSNGGCMSLKALNELLRKSASSSRPSVTSKDPLLPGNTAITSIPARAIVFDSCPGHSTLSNTLEAFTAGIKSRFVKYPAMAFFAVFFFVHKLVDKIRGQLPLLVRLSTYLNSPSFPAVPRLYLYSDADKLVPSSDVEAHAAAAEKQGIVVRREKFEGTPHVAHARKEGERYWGAVRRLWEEAGEA